MANLILNGSTSGSVTLSSPAVSGTTTLTLPATSGTVITTATGQTLTSPVIDGTPTGVGVLTSSTSQATTSGTSKDFTGIPSWVKRITVMFSGLSVSGTSSIILQLGDSGGIETTGYAGQTSTAAGTVTSFSTGYIVGSLPAASDTFTGTATISLLGSNLWIESGVTALVSGASIRTHAGSKSLSDVLTTVRLTTANGTDTFDAGSINILYE
jgi:hypothetical protein